MRRCVSLRLKARLEPEKPSGAIAVVAKMVPPFFGSTEYRINGRRRSRRRGGRRFLSIPIPTFLQLERRRK